MGQGAASASGRRQACALRLIVGLGNPGPKYARTRHNVGFRLLDSLAETPWRDFQGLGRVARREVLLLAQPLTYMNESGRFVSALARFHKVRPEELLVCFDDVALSLGRLRLRPGGSSGGQKGMRSIIEGLGTSEIPRLRLGIGPQPPGMDATDFVLSRFTEKEETALDEVLARGRDAVLLAASEGLELAMNRCNAEPEPTP